MASYRLFIKPSAVKDIEAIDRKRDRLKVVKRIRGLASDPRPPGCEKLSARAEYRVRQGRYRVVYTIEDEHLVVRVVKVSHRKDAYR